LYFFVHKIKKKLIYDDALDVFAAHGLGGLLGALLTGLFATTDINPGGANGAFYGNGRLFGVQLLACIIALVLSGFVTAVTLLILKKTIGIQVSVPTELEGLDKKYHAEIAYKTDVTTTTIKLDEMKDDDKKEEKDDKKNWDKKKR